MLKHGSSAMHDVRKRGHNKSPSGNQLKRVGETRRQPKKDILDKNFLENLKDNNKLFSVQVPTTAQYTLYSPCIYIYKLLLVAAASVS